MRCFALALAIACGGGQSRTTTTETKPTGTTPTSALQYPLRDGGVRHLVAAAQRHDAAAIAKMFDGPVVFGGLWFEDATCRFAAGTIPASQTAELARCIAQLPLAVATRTNAHPEIGVLAYGAGIEIEAMFSGTPSAPKLAWIGYASRVTSADALPSVAQGSFEAHRIDPQPLAFDDATRSQIDAELAVTAEAFRDLYGWFKVCADDKGNVVRVQPRVVSSIAALPNIEAWLRGWKLRPFQLGAQLSPVCSLVHVGTPPEDRDARAMPAPIPAARAASLHVFPWVLEGRRVAGSKRVLPADMDKLEMHRAGGVVTALVHYCIDATGRVDAVTTLRGSGYPGYDRKWEQAIRTWQFKPFEHGGTAIGACTYTTYVYRQLGPPRVVR